MKDKYKEKAEQQRIENWKNKPLHGQFARLVEQPHIDKHLTWQWLKDSHLKKETEGFLISAQDQSLKTNYYKQKILKQPVDANCRLCKMHAETVDHIVSACPVLAPNEYTWRHDRIGQYIHLELCKFYNIETQSKEWYNHKPEDVAANNDVVILWNVPIITDREIKCNRPDIVIKDKTNRTCYLIDFTVPNDNNVSVKEQEKLSKYNDLKLECSKMWGMKTDVIPVVVGATGAVKKGVKQNIDKIPGVIKIEMIQKIALLGTANILRKVLNLTC